MISLLTDFVQELRTAGLPVSMVEAIDAMEAITHIDLADRSALKAALGATMVKNSRHEEAFSTVFDVFFSVVSRPVEEGEQGEERPTWTGEGSTAGEEMGTDQLIEAMFEALSAEDFEELRRLAKEAVDRLAGIEPGRPVGGTYYLYRTMRQLDVDSLRDRLLQA
ncbi:MAG: hypothetical protein OEX04_18645, partial [Acidimicrobiia bacterium]|nr:hypothetical protein [Acidimicrobiia bacterium]